jgi:hypothetical protein
VKRSKIVIIEAGIKDESDDLRIREGKKEFIRLKFSI